MKNRSYLAPATFVPRVIYTRRRGKSTGMDARQGRIPRDVADKLMHPVPDFRQGLRVPRFAPSTSRCDSTSFRSTQTPTRLRESLWIKRSRYRSSEHFRSHRLVSSNRKQYLCWNMNYTGRNLRGAIGQRCRSTSALASFEIFPRLST